MPHPISTFPRFMYLNAYAFLLLMVGIGIAVIPCYRIGWWLVGLQIIAVVVPFRGAYSIFSSWKDKKRKYDLLMQRNADSWRPDTFTEYMQAPCGQLLSRIVLRDMGYPERYSELRQLRKPFSIRLREAFRPQRTTVYINEKYTKEEKS